jgi:DNA-binding transcriptional LysR family regulator
MTLDQLRVFIAVAEREHVTRAAEVLNLTQSAVSAAIHALESRHDVVLFYRVGRRNELTPAGRLFLAEARAVLERARAAETALDELGDLVRGTLAVSASQTIASYWLPTRLVRFRERFAGIDIRLRVGTTASVARDVVDGVSEVGFIEGPVEEPATERQRVGGDRLVIIVGAAHPWFGDERVTIDDLQRTCWYCREVGSGTRDAFNGALADLGIRPAALKIALELPTNNAVRAAVIAGEAAAGLSHLVVEDALALGTLFRVPIDLPERDFFLLQHRERSRSKAATAFVEALMHAPPVKLPPARPRHGLPRS